MVIVVACVEQINWMSQSTPAIPNRFLLDASSQIQIASQKVSLVRRKPSTVLYWDSTRLTRLQYNTYEQIREPTECWRDRLLHIWHGQTSAAYPSTAFSFFIWKIFLISGPVVV